MSPPPTLCHYANALTASPVYVDTTELGTEKQIYFLNVQRLHSIYKCLWYVSFYSINETTCKPTSSRHVKYIETTPRYIINMRESDSSTATAATLFIFL